MSIFDSLRSDLRCVWRLLVTHARFTALVTVTLALTIGASTAVFSVVHAVLLRPLPYAQSDRLVWVWSVHERNALKQRASYPDFRDWREQTRTLDLVGHGGLETVLTGAGEPERLRAELFVGDLFALLGVAPALGAPSSAADGSPAAILSHALWQRRFAADPGVIGTTVVLDGDSYAVAAVMPAGFQFPVRASARIDLWLPVERFNPALAEQRNARLIEVLGRLRPGVPLEDAQAELDVVAANLSAQYPDTNRGFGVRLVPALEEATGGVARGLLLLGSAVGALLLIGCVNVASLLLARTLARRKELGVRAALGAGRGRLARQLMLESVAVAGLGGILGVLLAHAAVAVARSMLAGLLPRAAEIAVDANALGVAAAVSLGTGLLIGLAPVASGAGAQLADELKHGGSMASHGIRGRRTFSALIVGQMALATLLLAAAGMFIHSFLKLDQSESTFDAANVLTFRINWPPAQYRDPADAFGRLRAGLLDIPGVLGASTGLQLPDRGEALLDDTAPFAEIEGRPRPLAERPRVATLPVQPGFLRTLGIPLVAGRDFGETDRAGAPPVAIVNRAFARAYLGGQTPLGETLRLDSWRLHGESAAEIVGVAEDAAHQGLRADAEPMVYLPFAQRPVWGAAMVVKTRGDPLSFVPAVRAAVRALDPDVPIDDVATLEQRLAASLAEDRLRALLLGAFSVLAVVLAAVGLFGALSYTTAQRVRELGIRMALGARSADVAGAVVARGMAPVLLGMLIGLGGAAASFRLVEGLLFEVPAIDAAAFGVAVIVLLSTAAVACAIPAHRAARMDPAILRGD